MGVIRDEANVVYADGPSTSPQEPEKASIRSLFATIDAAIEVAAAGLTAKATWADLSAITGTRNGQVGRVTGPDAGTHTDPVVGGTVANEGEYAWSTSPAGWQRIGNIQDVEGALDEIADVDTTLSTLTLADDLIYIGTAYEVDAVDPAGEIVQGIDKETGLPLVGGGGGGVGTDPALITVIRAAGSLQIHFPQADGESYVRWTMQRLTNAGQRSDVWQVSGVHEASLAGSVSTSVKTICDTGQVEAAFKPNGGSFTIGGDAHGRDEMLADPTLLLDGVEVDINGGAGVFTCKRVEIFQASQLLDSADLSNFAKRYTRWLFADGELELTNHIIVEKAIDFATIYLAMLPVVRVDGATQITHSAIRSPLFYPVADVSGTHTDAKTTADHIKVWGDTYSAEVQVLEGWDSADRDSWISSDNSRNKIYFAPYGVDDPYTPGIGEILRMRSRLRVAKLNS